MVGEVFLLSTEAVATYYGARRRAPPGLQLPAPVRPVAGRPVADLHRGRPRLRSTPGVRGRPGCSPTTTTPATAPATTGPPPGPARTRPRRPAAARPRARAAAVLLLTLRGTPFVYQGDELGLADADIPSDRRGRSRWARRLPGPDPLGRVARPRLADPRRGDDLAAVPSRGRRAQPGGRGRPTRGRSSTSTVGPITLRRTPALSRGSFELLDAPDGVLGFRRAHDGDPVEVVVNFSGVAVDVGRPGMRRCAGAAGLGRPGAGRPWFTGVLGPDQAVVLRRGPSTVPHRAAHGYSQVSCQKSTAPKSPSDMEWSPSWPLWRMQHTSVPIHGPLSMQCTAPHRCHCLRLRAWPGRRGRSRRRASRGGHAGCVVRWSRLVLPLVVVGRSVGPGGSFASTCPVRSPAFTAILGWPFGHL